MLLNLRGRKLELVSTWKSANAAKEKFAGDRENSDGIELLKLPVAGTIGVFELIFNPGTRGIVKARTKPILQYDRRHS